MLFRILSTCLLIVALTFPASAGPSSDRFALCLVKSTTPSDQVNLIRWIASIIGKHPDIADLVDVSTVTQDNIDKDLGNLFTRLVALDCKNEAYEASVLDGDVAFELAFEVLGQVAMVNLMEHENVILGFDGFLRYIDFEAFEFLE